MSAVSLRQIGVAYVTATSTALATAVGLNLYTKVRTHPEGSTQTLQQAGPLVDCATDFSKTVSLSAARLVQLKTRAAER